MLLVTRCMEIPRSRSHLITATLLYYVTVAAMKVQSYFEREEGSVCLTTCWVYDDVRHCESLKKETLQVVFCASVRFNMMSAICNGDTGVKVLPCCLVHNLHGVVMKWSDVSECKRITVTSNYQIFPHKACEEVIHIYFRHPLCSSTQRISYSSSSALSLPSDVSFWVILP